MMQFDHGLRGPRLTNAARLRTLSPPAMYECGPVVTSQPRAVAFDTVPQALGKERRGAFGPINALASS